MVPIGGVGIPVTIQTDEMLEKLAAQKAADDAAQKLANKAAKQAAHLECKPCIESTLYIIMRPYFQIDFLSFHSLEQRFANISNKEL